MTQSLQLSPQQAATELLKRRKARANLIAFTEYTFPQYETADHHQRIAEKLEAVERGEIDRLMVFMPPRHGKSELVSKRFPAWCLGRDPDKQIIQASYNSDLATDFGREVRNIVNSAEYSALFKTGLAADSRAANRWNTSSRGAYVAAGVGTAVTGRGAHLFIIDDPLKDREEAESESRRQKVWDWYTSTAYTRLMKGGAVVLVQTRWHEDDIAGRLLEAEDRTGDKWEKVILPAIDTTGAALWPSRYDEASLSRIRNAIGPRDWTALYQQHPAPEEGTFFKAAWFRRHSELPPGGHFYIFSDYAVSDGKGDYTEHGVAYLLGEDIYICGWWSGQTTSDVWIDELCALIKRHKPLCVFGEAGVIAKAVEPMMASRMRELQAFARVEWLPSISDKATRARAFQSRAAMGRVSVMSGPDGDRVVDQLIRFPAGKYDDAVDVCGMIGRALDEAHPGIAPRAVPQAPARSDYKPKQTQGAGWR